MGRVVQASRGGGWHTPGAEASRASWPLPTAHLVFAELFVADGHAALLLSQGKGGKCEFSRECPVSVWSREETEGGGTCPFTAKQAQRVSFLARPPPLFATVFLDSETLNT